MSRIVSVYTFADMPDHPAISRDEVRRVARLARLELTPDELDENTSRLAALLGYVERLGRLNLDGVEPLSNPLDATNRIDHDEPRDPLPTDALMKMAPAAHPPFVKVPKVLGEGGGA